MSSRILIIEDETSIAELEKDYLELSGFEVELEEQGDVNIILWRRTNAPTVINDVIWKLNRKR